MTCGRSVEIGQPCQALKTVPCAEVWIVVLHLLCKKKRAATDLTHVGNGRVSWGPHGGVRGCGAVLCHLPRGRTRVQAAAMWGAECFSETLSTLTTNSGGKRMKGHIYLWHLTGLDRDFYPLARYCSVDVNLKTYYGGFSMLVCVSLC